MQRFRHGQWVKWQSPAVGGAHNAADGLAVGVYQRDPGGDYVCPATPAGENVESADTHRVCVPVDSCRGLQAVQRREDVPPGRLATYSTTWQPQP
jgi:hypothetical protein